MLGMKLQSKSDSYDVNYHLEQLECDLARIKYNDNRNYVLTRSIDILLRKVDLVKNLVAKEPKYYMNEIYEVMKMTYKEDNSIEGFLCKLKFNDNSRNDRLAMLEVTLNKNNDNE